MERPLITSPARLRKRVQNELRRMDQRDRTDAVLDQSDIGQPHTEPQLTSDEDTEPKPQQPEMTSVHKIGSIALAASTLSIGLMVGYALGKGK